MLGWLEPRKLLGEEEPLIPRINFINSPLSDPKELRDVNG